jgi:hypothetical protein
VLVLPAVGADAALGRKRSTYELVRRRVSRDGTQNFPGAWPRRIPACSLPHLAQRLNLLVPSSLLAVRQRWIPRRHSSDEAMVTSVGSRRVDGGGQSSGAGAREPLEESSGLRQNTMSVAAMLSGRAASNTRATRYGHTRRPR